VKKAAWIWLHEESKEAAVDFRNSVQAKDWIVPKIFLEF